MSGPGSVPDLEGFAGLKPVRDRFGEWLAVVRAERARAELGMTISRPTWKNLVFTGAASHG